jgi:hypothetical protein
MALLRQAQEALGGKAFIEQKSQIMKGTGTMTFPGAQQPTPMTSYAAYQILPDKQRIEINLPMGSMIQAYDGPQAWLSMASQVQDISEQLKERHFYGFDVLRQAGRPGYTARPLPDAEVNGKRAAVVELADAEGHATRFFLDPATHLVLKVAYELGVQKPEQLLSDYREVAGVKVPFKVTSPQMDLQYSEVQVNAPVDAGLFRKPQG